MRSLPPKGKQEVTYTPMHPDTAHWWLILGLLFAIINRVFPLHPIDQWLLLGGSYAFLRWNRQLAPSAIYLRMGLILLGNLLFSF